MGLSSKVAVVDCREGKGVWMSGVGDGGWGAGTGSSNGGKANQFTNLKSDSLYVFHSMAVNVL